MKVFFDLDGTLLDIAPRHYEVYKDVVIYFGGQPLSQQVYWELKRKKTKWPLLLPKSKLNPDIEQDFLNVFIDKIESTEYLKKDKLFPGALVELSRISVLYKCYLVSLRRKHDNLIKQISWLGLAPFFTEVLAGHSESDGHDVKTNIISNKLKASSGVIIGDTEADIVTGKNLHLTTIALTTGIRDDKFLMALEPDYIIDSIQQLHTIFEEM